MVRKKIAQGRLGVNKYQIKTKTFGKKKKNKTENFCRDPQAKVNSREKRVWSMFSLSEFRD